MLGRQPIVRRDDEGAQSAGEHGAAPDLRLRGAHHHAATVDVEHGRGASVCRRQHEHQPSGDVALRHGDPRARRDGNAAGQSGDLQRTRGGVGGQHRQKRAAQFGGHGGEVIACGQIASQRQAAAATAAAAGRAFISERLPAAVERVGRSGPLDSTRDIPIASSRVGGRLRRPVRPADRAASPGGPGVLRGHPAHRDRRGDQGQRSAGHRAVRRTGQRVRRRRPAAGPGRVRPRRAGVRHLLRLSGHGPGARRDRRPHGHQRIRPHRTGSRLAANCIRACPARSRSG